jgi:spore germination cell wall hydrolase CwlJ-like protein
VITLLPKKITAFLLLAWTGFCLLALPVGLISSRKSVTKHRLPPKVGSTTPVKTQSPTRAVAKVVKPELNKVTTGANIKVGASLPGVATKKPLPTVNASPLAKPARKPSQPVNTAVLSKNSQTKQQPQKAADSAYQFQMLARIISAEAKGEPFHGQVAVGAVILNRIASGRFPKTIAANVLKPGQFEPVANGSIWNEPTASAYRAAHLSLKGWDPTGGALYFFNPVKTSSRWIWSRPIVKRIGAHVFAV